MSRGKRTFLNLCSNIFVQIVLGISGLIIPRMILQNFGSDINGLVNSVSQYVYYASLIELGIGNAAVLLYYKPIVENNYNRISIISSEVKKRYIKSGGYYTLIIGIMAFVYPVFVKTSFSYELVVSLIFIMAGATTIDFYIIGKYKVILLAFQRYYIVNLFKILTTIINTILSVFLLLCDHNIHCVKFVIVITHFCEGLALAYYTRKNFPLIKFNSKQRIILPQQKNTLIHQIVSIITYNTDLIVLSTCLRHNNMKEVSVYSVYMLVASMINNLMSSLVISMDATFGEMIAKKEIKGIKKIFKHYEDIYLIINYGLWSCYAALVLPFIRCYVSDIDDVNYIRAGVAILFTVNGLLANAKDPHGILIRAYGHYKESQKYVIAEACVNLILSIILVHKYGLVGVLIGTLVGHIIGNIGLTYYGDVKLLNRCVFDSIKPQLMNSLVLGFALIIELQSFIHIDKWGGWFFIAGVTAIINFILLFFINYIFNRESFLVGIEWIKREYKR